MNYRSYDDLLKLIRNKIYLLPKDVDLIVGIPRSGLLIANLIGLFLNKPITDFDGFLENRIISSGKTKKTNNFFSDVVEAKKILIVEDSVASGASITFCKENVTTKYKGNAEIMYLSVYTTRENKSLVDIYFEIVDMPRLFEWNIMHHPIINNACFDIDGVLCVDPKEEDNDDGERYRKFLNTAAPLYIPTQRIGALVSSRLSKYTSETIRWCKRNHIEFDKIHLMDCTFEERRANGNHARFKADIYMKGKYALFVESEKNQAEIINKLSGKPVFCIENGFMYDGSFLYKSQISLKSKLKKWLYFNKNRGDN